MLSTITIAEPRDARGKLVLLRSDFPNDTCYVWCGHAMGWLPNGALTASHRAEYTTMRKARKAARVAVLQPCRQSNTN